MGDEREKVATDEIAVLPSNNLGRMSRRMEMTRSYRPSTRKRSRPLRNIKRLPRSLPR
jgi:hypothetical protein